MELTKAPEEIINVLIILDRFLRGYSKDLPRQISWTVPFDL